MNSNAKRFFLTAFIAVAAGLISAVFGPAFAQTEAGRGLPHDWSHRHLIYPNPDTRDEAARKGSVVFDQWKKMNKDPRFAAQVAKKERFSKAKDGNPFSPAELKWAKRFDRNPTAAASASHRDWSVALNAGANAAQGYGKAAVFPAKFGFKIDATPDCAKDFVVFPTTGKGAVASVTYAVGTVASPPPASNSWEGKSITITNPNTSPARTLTLTARAAPSLATDFAYVIGNSNTTATNLANAIVRNGAAIGVTETGAGRPNVKIQALDPGAAGNNIGITANSLPAFLTTPGSQALASLALGSDPPTSRPTIVAFNGLYIGYTDPQNVACPVAPNPASTYWAYNTGAAFTETSPVLSESGDQVAFTQRGGANGAASLVLLKWKSGDGTIASPYPPNSVAADSYPGCSAPCMLVLPFAGNAPNTNSSPFYDYQNDILYVGDSFGKLHKFINVFKGTALAPPAEAGSPWPVTVSAGNMLTSPVYDYNGSPPQIFVGSASGNSSGTSAGGLLHRIDAATGAPVNSGPLAAASSTTTNSAGVRDSPIVDSIQQKVYVFVGTDRSTSCSASPCAAVYQFATNFSSNTTGTRAQVGRGVVSISSGLYSGTVLYSGTFDDAYYTAPGTGHLYVCGSAAGTAQRPTLWQIPIDSSNVVQTPVAGPLLVSASANCSPVTEILNGTTNDYIYASVTANGANRTGGCSGTAGCIFMFNLNGLIRSNGQSTTWGATGGAAVVANAGFAAVGGTSGIIIDNISATAGASQAYYSTLGTGTGGNAIQASQAALQ